MPKEFTYDVFLSHSSKDKAIVRQLAERLRQDGLKVWFDESEIKPGDSIPSKIEYGLENSHVLILCMSTNAFGSDWSQLESQTFRFRDPLNKERRFIPLRLDDAPIKGSLAQFLYINWRSPDREWEYAKLLASCRHPDTWPSVSSADGDQTIEPKSSVQSLEQSRLEGEQILKEGQATFFKHQLWEETALVAVKEAFPTESGKHTFFVSPPKRRRTTPYHAALKSEEEHKNDRIEAWKEQLEILGSYVRQLKAEAERNQAGKSTSHESGASGYERIKPEMKAQPSLRKDDKTMKVLALFANPKGTNTLRLGEEDRTLQESIRRSKNRDRIGLIIRHAVTVDDIRRALLDDTFDVVHFSGHGTGSGLVFEDSSGRMYVPPQDAIAELLASFSPPLQCVVLNACYSLEQGTLASLGLPFTVAMEGPIADEAAIVFSGGFYDSLAAGKDVEFSFKQGIVALKLAKHPDSSVPRLIRKGESLTLEKAEQQPRSTTRDVSELSEPLLVGVALDVSGSMEASISNRVGGRESRLEAFQIALQQGAERGREFLNSVERMDAPVRLFSYAFGLRTGDVCDLFSMMKAADGVISQPEIETLKQQYTAEITRRYSSSSLAGYESLARSFFGSHAVDSVIEGARADAEREVRARIMAEIQRRLSARLARIGDTTIPLNELVELWKGSRQSFSDAEGLIFGQTPMCGALKVIKERFTRELHVAKGSNEKPTTVLLLVSDGESTDGDPVDLAEQLKNLGVTIIGCYILIGA